MVTATKVSVLHREFVTGVLVRDLEPWVCDLERPCGQRHRPIQRYAPAHIRLQHPVRQPGRDQRVDQHPAVVRQQSSLSISRRHDETGESKLLCVHDYPRVRPLHLPGVWIIIIHLSECRLLWLFYHTTLRSQFLPAVVNISLAFGIVTTITMLGFATVQYFAICRPLQHLYVLRRRKVVVFLAVTWTTSLIGGFAPLTVLALIVRTKDCATWLLAVISTVVRHGVNADAAFLALVHVIILPSTILSWSLHDPVHDFLIPTLGVST